MCRDSILRSCDHDDVTACDCPASRLFVSSRQMTISTLYPHCTLSEDARDFSQVANVSTTRTFPQKSGTGSTMASGLALFARTVATLVALSNSTRVVDSEEKRRGEAIAATVVGRRSN
jgi:hypothetical protein